MNRRPSRLAGVLLGTAAAAASLVVSSPAPSLATASGSLSFAPATGDDGTNIIVTTDAACPDAATHVRVLVTGGSGGGAVTDGVIVGLTSKATFASGDHMVIPLTQSMHDFAQTVGFTPIDGTYVFTVRCSTNDIANGLMDFVGSLDWTQGASAFTGTYVVTPSAVGTTLSLDVAPAAPVVAGVSVTLTATVTPGSATGSVQFKDGATNLGAPVAVSVGEAQYVTTALTPATHSLSAVFTPADPTAFGGSSASPVSYQVLYAPQAFLPTVFPAPRVGMTSFCVKSSANATAATYAWLKNGVVISGATGSGLAVPESAYGAKLSCRVTLTNPDNPPLVGTSPQLTVGVGPALRATALPYLYGTVKVGYRVYCKPGAWTPSATAYLYRWRLDGKATSITASSMVLPSSWRYHLVSCTVTARRSHWTDGIATSKAIKVG